MDTSYRNCPVAKYHFFNVLSAPYLVAGQFVDRNANHADIQVEVCKHCGVRKEYHFNDEGQMVEDHQYFLDHIRAFVQPSMGEVYFDIYPEARMRMALEAKAQKAMQEKHEGLSDKFKFAIKRALDDKDDGIKK